MKSKQKALEKAKDEYEMPRSKAIAEHKRLVKVLKSHKGLKKEGEIQGREVKEIIKD